MAKILVFDKGGRKERMHLVKNNKAPRDFLQGIDFLKSKKIDIQHLSSSKRYKRTIIFFVGRFIEEIVCKFSDIGIRPLSVFQFRKLINNSKYIVSLTDGFSLSLGFYYSYLDKKNKIKLAGAFHGLSDYDKKLPNLFKKFYYRIYCNILKRLDFIIFYGPADRLYSIKHFNLNRDKTYIIKFGVDTSFWKPNSKNNFYSKYLFSIGQDRARDFQTLIKVKTKKLIHIHTSLLDKFEDENIKITNGTYNNLKNSFSDLTIRNLYQDSFAVIVPLKDVFQPSGYSVTLQAMACGKPVILTLTKGLWAPNIFKSFENCILVSPKNVKEIESAIKNLESDPNLYKNICINARKIVEEFFSINAANQSTLEIFENFK